MDIIIYSKRLDAETVTFFRDLLPENIKENVGDYDLRPGAEWDSTDIDRSISRCPKNNFYKAFDFFSYKLAISTPGEPNACGEAFTYILADRSPDIQDVEQPMDAHMDIDSDETDGNSSPQQKRQKIMEAIDRDVQEIDDLTPSSSINFEPDEHRRIHNFYKTLEKNFINTCESMASQILSNLQQKQDISTCFAEEKNVSHGKIKHIGTKLRKNYFVQHLATN
uniref:Uncharacterized protein n=1 Tax=Panagrolaimus superbus TaxID=310955 RepID=A0A914XT08_9BILA